MGYMKGSPASNPHFELPMKPQVHTAQRNPVEAQSMLVATLDQTFSRLLAVPQTTQGP